MSKIVVLALSSLAISQGYAQSNSLSLTCDPAGAAQVGVTYTNTCSVTGGTAPYQWRVDFLPRGLTYKTAATIPVSTIPVTTTPIAIQITGVAAVAGPFGYTVTVADSTSTGAQTATKSVTGTISPWTQGPIISGVFGAGLSNPPVTQVSPDGLIAIFGADFTPAGMTHALQDSDLIGGKLLPSSMLQTCVRIGGLLAPLYYVSPTQINAQVPDIGSSGTADISVVTNCGASNELATAPVTVALAPLTPEFLSWVQNPNGTDSVVSFIGSNNNLVGSPGLIPGVKFTVASNSEVIAIYGVGFGPATTPVPAGMWSTDADSILATTAVTIGGHAAKVLYAGLAPGFAGLYQVNVEMPSNLLTGNQPISIQVNGVSSPGGTYVPFVGFDLEGSASLASLKLTPAAVGVGVGQTTQVGVQLKNLVGFQLFATTGIAWVSSDPQIAAVSAGGTIFGISPGTATITAFYAGVSGQATVTVQ